MNFPSKWREWHAWSKLNSTKWTTKFYGSIFNGTSVFKKLRQFIDPILITYEQMHPVNNAC